MTRARRLWLQPSLPPAVDEAERASPVHQIRLRDRRARFGDAEIYVAECSCGWTSEAHNGRLADRFARRDGLAHVDDALPNHGYRGRALHPRGSRRAR